MASNTENLDLLMKNPSTDGADTFNVQTMLNDNWQKIDNNAGTVAQTLANILKPTTPPIIGLPPSTTPDGMFQALGNTGELHVWRKTVVTKEPVPEVPGSYTLGTAQRLYVATRTFANSSYESYVEGVLASNAITIDLDGKVTLTDPAEVTLYIYNRRDGVTSQTGREAISGYSYFLIPSTSASFIGCEISMTKDEIYYIPATSNYYRTSSSSGGQSSFDAAQLVTGVPGTPAIPAGTTTTYPVSTNPNAYQEGDDAKEAGYVLGDIVKGSFVLSVKNNGSTGINWKYSDDIAVSDAGMVELVNPYSATINAYGYASNAQSFRGKFITTTLEGTDFIPDTVCFIPAEANIAQSGDKLVVDRYQPVTGYAAIPAGTTIEYLGKLGDKARVQVVSYVGTGTYGESNPCSISVDFPMKAIVFLARVYTNGGCNKISTYFVSSSYANDVSSVLVERVPKTYSQFLGLGNNYYGNNFGKRSKDRKSYYWYNTDNANDQGNFAGTIYYFLVIG